MWTESKSEDVWTSLKLHENGWKSIYISTVLAIGDTPTTIEAYTKQQLRWATGGFEILFKSNPFSRKLKLTLDQRLQYFGTATFYLMGVAPGLLLLVPPLQIYFGLAPINSSVSFGTWLLYYLGFYCMQVIVALYTIGSFRWETLMLATASFPIYGRALVNAIFNKDQKWHVTGSTVEEGLAVQLHHAPADGVRVPGHHLGGRHLAGPHGQLLHPGAVLEPAEHLHPRAVRGHRVPRGPRQPPRGQGPDPHPAAGQGRRGPRSQPAAAWPSGPTTTCAPVGSAR